MLQTGHADVGVLVLQDLVRTRPDSVGGRVARAELERRHELEGLEHARFLSAEMTGGCASRSCAVVAVWNECDSNVRWIAARLPERDVGQGTRTVAFDDAAYEEARPALQTAIRNGWLDGLLLMQGLPGGADRFVDSYLDGVARFEWRKPAELGEADQRLRWLHGGGPEDAMAIRRGDWGAFADDWRSWRATTGAQIRPAR